MPYTQSYRKIAWLLPGLCLYTPEELNVIMVFVIIGEEETQQIPLPLLATIVLLRIFGVDWKSPT